MLTKKKRVQHIQDKLTEMKSSAFHAGKNKLASKVGDWVEKTGEFDRKEIKALYPKIDRISRAFIIGGDPDGALKRITTTITRAHTPKKRIKSWELEVEQLDEEIDDLTIERENLDEELRALEEQRQSYVNKNKARWEQVRGEIQRKANKQEQVIRKQRNKITARNNIETAHTIMEDAAEIEYDFLRLSDEEVEEALELRQESEKILAEQELRASKLNATSLQSSADIEWERECAEAAKSQAVEKKVEAKDPFGIKDPDTDKDGNR